MATVMEIMGETVAACSHLSCLAIALVIPWRRVVARASRHTRRLMFSIEPH